MPAHFSATEMARASLGLNNFYIVAAGGTKDLSAGNERIFCIMPEFDGETVLLDATTELDDDTNPTDLTAGTKSAPIYGNFKKVVLDATSNTAMCYRINANSV